MWTRLGQVLAPPGIPGWAASHAMMPFLGPDRDEPELYFSGRDESGRTHVGRSRLHLDAGDTRVEVDPRPVLGPGALGAFDDSGTTGSCLVRDGDRLFLYYVGWSLGRTVPFWLFTGLAVSEDGGRSFARASRAPVVGRSDVDPFLATAPWVMRDGGRWRMWYTSADRWEDTPDGPRHHYRVVYGESADGINWEPTGRVCIDYADESEYAIGRPCVVRDEHGYHMWFSCRGPAYRIGYATSEDGLEWTRRDDAAGLTASDAGWDSESVEYGFVFDRSGRRWMLFNGNGYGATGVGLARWDGDDDAE
jgi:hypothetical protein